MSNADRAVSNRNYLKVNGFPDYVRVDERFPLGVRECYMLPRVKSNCSEMVRNIPFYVTLSALEKLENGGKGVIYGRTEWGPYCKLVCIFYRVNCVIRLTDEQEAAVRQSIYEEEVL